MRAGAVHAGGRAAWSSSGSLGANRASDSHTVVPSGFEPRVGDLELRRQRCPTVVKNPNRLVSSGPGTPPLPIHDGKSGKILGVRWNGGGTGTYLPETDGLHGVLATHKCDCRPPPMATKATARSRTHAHGAWRLRAHRTWRPTRLSTIPQH